MTRKAKMAPPYVDELAIILQDERLAPIRDLNPELLAEAISNSRNYLYPANIVTVASTYSVLEESALTQNFFAKLGLEQPPFFVERNNATPILNNFHALLVGRLMPSNPALAQSAAYWEIVLDFFSKPNPMKNMTCGRIFEQSKNNTLRERSYSDRISESRKALLDYFGWLQSFYERTGIIMSVSMADFCYERLILKKCNHRMNRVFAEFLIIACHELGFEPGRFSLIAPIANETEKMAFKSRKANALTLRNLAYAIVEFMLFAYPIFEKRFGASTTEQIFTIHEANGYDRSPDYLHLFYHWCWRSKRNFSLYLGFDAKVLPEFRMIPKVGVIKYLPVFFLKEFMKTNLYYGANFADCIVHLGTGKSLRSVPCMPENLSAKALHFFAIAPFQSDFNQAIVFGIAMAETNNQGIANILSNINIFRNVRVEALNVAFTTELSRFFGHHRSDLQLNEINPICDFVFHKLGENPEFTLKGRTLHSVRRMMEDWHLQLRQQRALIGIPPKWKGSAIKGISLKWEEKTYIIKQITTQNDIINEGAAMRHCVASYASGCVYGHHSIWSLCVLHEKSPVRLITIQLASNGTIVQARGLQNRMPTPTEVLVMKKWCGERGLMYRN